MLLCRMSLNPSGSKISSPFRSRPRQDWVKKKNPPQRPLKKSWGSSGGQDQSVALHHYNDCHVFSLLSGPLLMSPLPWPGRLFDTSKGLFLTSCHAADLPHPTGLTPRGKEKKNKKKQSWWPGHRLPALGHSRPAGNRRSVGPRPMPGTAPATAAAAAAWDDTAPHDMRRREWGGVVVVGVTVMGVGVGVGGFRLALWVYRGKRGKRDLSIQLMSASSTGPLQQMVPRASTPPSLSPDLLPTHPRSAAHVISTFAIKILTTHLLLDFVNEFPVHKEPLSCPLLPSEGSGTAPFWDKLNRPLLMNLQGEFWPGVG